MRGHLLVMAVVLGLCAGSAGCVFYLNPQCNDQIHNGEETDVDCGGGCARCEIADSCKVDADCADSMCEGGRCTPFPCFNGRKDIDETDVDCGGPTCRKCAGARACAVNADCASDSCVAASGTCFQRAVSFAEPVVLEQVGDKPYVMFSIDLDGDGDIDLVSANELESTLTVLRNQGNGAFDPPGGAGARFTTGAYPTGGAVGDFDHDGVVDLITADYHGDSVSVLFNLGTGALSAAVSYPTLPGAETSNLAIGHLDGNLLLDVVASNPKTHSVSVFLGQPDGTLTPAVDVPVGISGSSFPYSVAVGDFDGDGNDDLAIADNTSATLIVRLGNGDGTFGPEDPYDSRGTPDLIVITSDVNGDGKLDLVSANRKSDNVSVLLGRGDGTFRKAILSSTGAMTGPYSLVVGDFNQDHVLDVVTADYITGDASVLIGIGDGSFEPPILIAGRNSYSVTVGDFNHDGALDFASANYGDTDDSVTVVLQR